MVNHSTENSKSNQKQTRINKETQQWIQTESEVGSSCGSYKLSDGVKAELSRMNTNVENLLGCFYRLMHDRGKELDCSFNGGFDELGEIRIREHGGVIENQEFQSEFGFQFQEDSSMESGEASHHPYMVDLIRNGDSEASRQQTNHGSEILEAKIQAMWNLVNRTQTGDEGMRKSHPFATSDIMLEKIHRVIEKSNVQLSGFEVNSLKNYYECTVFEEDMAEVEMEEGLVETGEVLVETEEVLIEAEVILGDEEPGNAISTVAVNANIEIGDESYNTENEEVKLSENGGVCFIPNMELSESVCLVINSDSTFALTGSKDDSVHIENIRKEKVVGSLIAHSETVEGVGLARSSTLATTGGCFIVANNRNVDIAGQKDATVGSNRNEKIAGDTVSKNGLLQIIVNDPFYDAIKSVLVNDKRQLMLAVGLSIYKAIVEFDCCLMVLRFPAKCVAGCEVCMWVLISQDICADEMVVQQLRKGVG